MSAPAFAYEQDTARRDEQALLGALFLSPKAFFTVDQEVGVRPEHFQLQRHAEVYRAMRVLSDADWEFDIRAVRSHLAQTGKLEAIGGDAALDELAGPVLAAGNVRRYALNVREHYKRRATRAMFLEGLQALDGGGETDEVRAAAELRLIEIAGSTGSKDFRSLAELVREEQNKLEDLAEGKVLPGSIPTGYVDLDEALHGGVRPGELVIVAGRPAMGKSAFVQGICEHMGLNTGNVGLFSLEMGESQLTQRLIASRARIPSKLLRTGELMPNQWAKVMAATNDLSQAALFIDDSSDLSVSDIRAKARRLHMRHPLKLLVVDYMQQVREQGDGRSRANEIGRISRGLKVLARELEIPVIALAQLSRRLEDRLDKRPVLPDLKESGDIEQDADIVLMLYRDEYYDEETSTPGICEVLIRKFRDGGLGVVELVFDGPYTRFSDLKPGRAAA